MNIKLSILGLLGLLFIPQAALAYGEKSLFYGSIQFPNGIEMIPNIRVYYAGRKVVCENSDATKRITFAVPELKQRTFFYLLITPDIEFNSHENTVPFLKLKRGQPYKFYTMELAISPTKNHKAHKKNINPYEYSWIVKELDLATITGGRLPDETLIVRYNPDFVQGLEGGTMVEFPKIVLKPDLLKLAGSEEKLHDLSNSWFLAALNTDTIHETAQSEVRINSQTKTILAMTA